MKFEEEELNRIQKQKIKTMEDLVILKNQFDIENKKKIGFDFYNERVKELSDIIKDNQE